MFSEILQNSQKNTCARDSFSKNSLWHRCFPVNFVKFLKTPFWQNSSGWLLMLRDYFIIIPSIPSHPPRPFNLSLYFKQTLQNKPLSTLFSDSTVNHKKFFPVVYCSKRNISFAWWGWHFNNIILAMLNFIFIILTFQSFNRGEEKVKWTYIFPYRYDLYKEKIFF